MKLIAMLLQVLALAPVVVKGVEALASEKDSVSKHQMAKDALTLATGVAEYVSPENAEEMEQVSGAVSAIIDHTVGTFNSVGLFKHKPAAVKAGA
jgi:hypothetical protein